MSRAGPQCQHVRSVPWSSCLTGGAPVSGGLCLEMDQGVWCRWTVRVACLCPLGASSRMVGGAQPSPNGTGPPALCHRPWGFRARSGVAGGVGVGKPRAPRRCPWVPASYALLLWRAEVCLEDASPRPLRVGEEWGMVSSAPHRAMSFICVGSMYTMVMVAPTRRRVSTLPAGCRWMSVYVAMSGP